MNGTILTSVASVEHAWSSWARRIEVAPEVVLDYMHGRRAVDIISYFSPPGADIAPEVKWLDDREHEDMEGIAEVGGALRFLSGLPYDRWAVVTSANRGIAAARMRAAGLPTPAVLVSCDDVANGKPDPEGYPSAAGQLGVDIKRCLVIEDTQAGVKAGFAAGAEVVLIAGTEHNHELPVRATLAGYESVSVDIRDDMIYLAVPRSE